MVIGNRLKELRESKQLSQGDIEKRTGLLVATSLALKMDTQFSYRDARKDGTGLGSANVRLFHDGEVRHHCSR